jgi:CO/xanthine dehydrogenase Mo-binding subunit
LPGIQAVLTGTDVPRSVYGRACLDIPILARDVVRFVGEKVAAVAADTSQIADEALSLIEVEYAELPAVFDANEALSESAPRVHDGPAQVATAVAFRLHGELRMYPPIPNVVSEQIVEHGDWQSAFAAAHRIFEHTFSVPSVHQGYIEPHTCLVRENVDGTVDVWMSHKSPHVARKMLADAVSVPIENINLHPVMIGGDFGGKGSLMDAPICYHLAKRSRRPVKMVMSYFEELTAGNPRHAATVTLRTAVDGDAQILGMTARMIYNCGAYAGFNPLLSIAGYSNFAGAYHVPACRLDVLRVHTNTVPAGHMRAPGVPQMTFAVESHLDMIAVDLGVNPFEFRQKNAIKDGELSAIGDRRDFIHSRAVMDAALGAWDWRGPKQKNVGRGMGLHEFAAGNFGRSTVSLTVGADGRITLVLGSPDTGTGFHTMAAQLVAGHFQVPIDQVSVLQADTVTSGFETGASGSRLTVTVGQAVADAAGRAKKSLQTTAALYFNCSADQISLRADGVFESPSGQINLKDLAAWAAVNGRAPIVEAGTNTPNQSENVTGFAAQVAEVEVDPETGQVTVRRIVTAHDVGTVVNPVTHQGQIDGGVIQALGHAMCEQLLLSDGAVVSATLGDYKLPTIADIPVLDTVLVESRDADRAFLKGVGEVSNVAAIAAIANAIYDAVGVRLTELPVSAERIYAALQTTDRAR